MKRFNPRSHDFWAAVAFWFLALGSLAALTITNFL